MGSDTEVGKAIANLKRFAARAVAETSSTPRTIEGSRAVTKTRTEEKWFGLVKNSVDYTDYETYPLWRGWELWSGNRRSSLRTSDISAYSDDTSYQQIYLRDDGRIVIVDVGGRFSSGPGAGGWQDGGGREPTVTEFLYPDQYWKVRRWGDKHEKSSEEWYDPSRPRYRKPCIGLSVAIKKNLNPPSRSRQ